MFRVFFSARIGQQADLMRAYQWGYTPNPNLLLYNGGRKQLTFVIQFEI